jgi:hypothetical protein
MGITILKHQNKTSFLGLLAVFTRQQPRPPPPMRLVCLLHIAGSGSACFEVQTEPLKRPIQVLEGGKDLLVLTMIIISILVLIV